MPHDVRKLLWDARDALDAVSGFLKGKNYGEFGGDRLLRSAVERQFEIAGEALAKAAKMDPGVARRIPNLRRAVDFRNVLIHAYAEVDPVLVWRAAMENLPELRKEVDALLPPERLP